MASRFSPMITFEFKPEKFLNAVAYLAANCPGATKKKICKLLYFADKEQMLKYGTPITGDDYYRLPHGPIPTHGLNLLRGIGSRSRIALRDQYFQVDGWKVKAKKAANLAVFSKSENRTLAAICARYGHLSADYLEALSHREPTWKKTKLHNRIDFALFFEGHPEADFLKSLVESETESRRVLSRYRAAT